MRVVSYGEAALLVTLGERPTVRGARRAQALAGALSNAAGTGPAVRPLAGLASVLVTFDPLTWPEATIRDRIAAAADGLPSDPPPPTDHREHEIPVRYGGTEGPDLDAIAEAAGLTSVEVAERHAGTAYEVLALGFAPGFAYLGELDPAIRVGRLATPRPLVPPGSVAIADALTGIYPAALPGGWRIVGRTDAVLFDPLRPEPATFRPGDRIRFVPAR